jgi:uncharacterized membrane protein
MNSKSFQEKDSRGITSFKSFIRFIKVLAFLAVMESLVYLVIKATAQNTTMHHLGNIIFHIVGLFTVFAVISPIIGQFITAGLGEMLRFIISPRSLYVVMKFSLAVYIMIIILSPLFVYRALNVWELPKLKIAYLYAGILGVLIGGILLLKSYIPRLKEHLGDSR